MKKKSNSPPKSLYFCIAASFLAGSALVVFARHFCNGQISGTMASGTSLTLFASGSGTGIYSLCKSGGRKRVLIPAGICILLNIGIAWVAYGVLSGNYGKQLFRVPLVALKSDFPFFTVRNPYSLAVKARSVDTSLASGKCRIVETADRGGYTLRSCPGVDGYKLLVEDFDSRMTITVVDPDNEEYPLLFGQYVTGHFSELGKKVEWRIAKVKGKEVPVALIVRVYSHGTGIPPNITPYLAVSKIAPPEICVTDRIGPGPNQSERAREAADDAMNSKCMDAVSD